MKKQILFIFGTFVLLLFWNFNILASEPVDPEVAKRAAEYHGESIFEKNLKICDHELMYWPWGEPAVYVFTLMEEGDYYPEPVYLDNPFLQGAYLVASGEKVKGYRMMAQADRYMTVFVGASTDMPSFIKSHEGLPEHVMARGAMNNLSPDPLWIYGGPFHIFVAKDMDMDVEILERADLEDVQATEIHSGYTVALRDLGNKKVGTIPDYEQEREWEPFLSSGEISEAQDFCQDSALDIQKKKQLPVEELNTRGNWEGCFPAAIYNILMYNYKMKRVFVPEGAQEYLQEVNFILLWIGICCRTYEEKGEKWTNPEWFVKGPKIVHRGLDTKANISAVWRKKVSRSVFFNKYKAEINKNYPVKIGEGDYGILQKHSCTGVGYSIKNGRIDIIIHDGWWHTPEPVRVNYAELEGKYMCLVRIRPKKRKIFASAVPELEGPEIVELDTSEKKWEARIKVSSKNKVNAYFCAIQLDFYNLKEKKKEKLCSTFTRIKPYYPRDISLYRSYPKYPRGRCEYKIFLIDDNGHMFQEDYSVRLEHIIGKWTMNYQWSGKKAGTSIWTIYDNGTFKSSSGQGGTWSLKNKNFTIRYATENSAVYLGKVSSDYEKMSGTMSNNKGSSGAWSTERISDAP